jgi:hypothetical protein
VLLGEIVTLFGQSIAVPLMLVLATEHTAPYAETEATQVNVKSPGELTVKVDWVDNVSPVELYQV